MKEKTIKHRILNVGCGKQKYGTHFIDLYPQRNEVIRCNLETEKIPFPDNFFDEVYSKNLLEHLKNPNRVLCEMYRVLKKKGKLVIITDNAGFWGWHIPWSKTHYGGYEEYGYGTKDCHYAVFTSWHLENHFKTLNLESITAEYLISRENLVKYKLIIKLISKFFGFFFKRMVYPQIKITGFK